jgi:hypothetical protein
MSMQFQTALTKTIHGFHLINDMPIKESVWEKVLSTALSHANIEHTWKVGGHQSGKDITISKHAISCKSCRETENHFKVSSYRMTKCNTIDAFIDEIDFKRANFDYYAIISRIETDSQYIYTVYAIPADLVKAKNMDWRENNNKKTNIVSSWETDFKNGIKMGIYKSMSNQLWITLCKEEFKQYIILDNVIVSRKNIINFATLYEKLNKCSI